MKKKLGSSPDSLALASFSLSHSPRPLGSEHTLMVDTLSFWTLSEREEKTSKGQRRIPRRSIPFFSPSEALPYLFLNTKKSIRSNPHQRRLGDSRKIAFLPVDALRVSDSSSSFSFVLPSSLFPSQFHGVRGGLYPVLS